MFRFSSRVLRFDVPRVNFLNVESFKFLKKPVDTEAAFLVKPEIGKLGATNSVILTHIPSPVNNDPIVKITSHPTSLFIVTESGKVFGQGTFKNSRLGNGTEEVSTVDQMVQIEGLPPVKQIVTGDYFSVALTKDGEVYIWGDSGNFFSSKSLGISDSKTTVPKKVDGFNSPIVQIACGREHILALDSNGLVYAWGNGEYGRLGQGTSSTGNVPLLVETLSGTKTKSIFASRSFSLVETEEGYFAWGKNESGQLGTRPSSFTVDVHNLESLPTPLFFKTDREDENNEAGETVVPDYVDVYDKLGVAYSNQTKFLYRWGQQKWVIPQIHQTLLTPIKKMAAVDGKKTYLLSKQNKVLYYNYNTSESEVFELNFAGDVHDIFNGYCLGIIAKVPQSLVESLPVHHTVSMDNVAQAATKSLFSSLKNVFSNNNTENKS